MRTFLLIMVFAAAGSICRGQNYQTMTSDQWHDNSWLTLNFDTCIFNSSGYVIQQISWKKDTVKGIWIYQSQSNMTYNPDGTKQEVITQQWDTAKKIWKNLTKVDYTYTATHKILTLFSEFWNNGAWNNGTRYTYFYDSNDFLVRIFSKNWNIQKSVWDSTLKQFNENYPDGTPRQIISYNYNTSTGKWNLTNRISYIYNTFGKTDTSLIERWNGSNWTNISKNIYKYDSRGFKILGSQLTWNTTTLSWDIFYIIIDTNNQDGSLYREVLQKWDKDQSLFYNYLRQTFTYRQITGMDFSFRPELKVFPNPSDGRFILNVKDFRPGIQVLVRDNTGKTVHYSEISSTTQVMDLSGNAPGIYFITLLDGSNSATGKIILK